MNPSFCMRADAACAQAPGQSAFVGGPVALISVDGMDLDVLARVVEVEVHPLIAAVTASAGMQQDPGGGHRVVAEPSVLVTSIPAVVQRQRHPNCHLAVQHPLMTRIAVST